MNEVIVTKDDEIVMKLLHYFITEKGYNPIVLHGAKNEIWLENLEADYRIIRIVTNYIHNDEQFNYDIYRTKAIMKRIKKKTYSLHMNAISIFLNLGDNVHIEKYDNHNQNLLCLDIDTMDDFKKYEQVMVEFPNITEETDFKEKGLELFMKVTDAINKKNETDARRAEDVFRPKKPIVTYILIAINVVVFLLMYLLGNGSTHVGTLLSFGANYAPYVLEGEYWRLLTSAFLHIGVIHLVFNMYALYVIGPQLESFYGKGKYLIIYLFSAIAGNLMSIMFTHNAVSAGASGAIFGLLGSLLYFGYHYRVYLGNVLKSQIIPLIILNLMMGLFLSGIDMAAHVGGLIGGILISMALGVKYKSTTFDKVNGWIMTIIFTVFMIYMEFIR